MRSAVVEELIAPRLRIYQLGEFAGVGALAMTGCERGRAIRRWPHFQNPPFHYHEVRMSLQLMSEKEAAATLGLSRITLHRLRKEGRLAFHRIGARVMYAEAQLLAFLASTEQNTAAVRDGRA